MVCYSENWMSDLQKVIQRDWETNFSHCKIASIALRGDNSPGGWAFVIYEEV